MGQGGISKGLIIASRMQGWDPTKIEGGGGDIENFDKAPKLFTNQAGTGRLPQGTPDSFPEDHPSISPGGTPFEVGAGGKAQADRKTSGANPFPAMPGAD
jgi:hypothetical protein